VGAGSEPESKSPCLQDPCPPMTLLLILERSGKSLSLVVGSATKKIVIVYICLSPAKNHSPTVSAIINSPC